LFSSSRRLFCLGKGPLRARGITGQRDRDVFALRGGRSSAAALGGRRTRRIADKDHSAFAPFFEQSRVDQALDRANADLGRPAYSRGRYQVPGNGSSPISWASSLLRRRSTSRRQMASLLGDDGGWERAMPKKNPARETGRAEVICLPFSPFEELAGGLPLAAQAAGLGHGYSDLATSAAPRSSRIRSRHTFFVDKPRALAARINIAL